ncbi:polysaccharide biosynthesis/export family protein [Rhizobium paknamense]|uniref:Exopolysaccharide production protein ExoF n=1 Tax=Rhizobium paknamense TaxID=1206817 RepID=A0ABU0IJI7_9HYPH|nr:polysaccharide biosynthesis/export family protein [Rhizobium paknamense]MDQ0458384.1 exopolysaccharide production protein ExoF [Rhizobium paknamense]
MQADRTSLSRLGGRALSVALAFSLSLPLAGLAHADEYHLGVMDKLRVRVAEWQTAEGAVRDWTAVSGDYAIGASGKVSIPFLGELSAAGRTTEDVSEDIGKRMQQLFGLRDRPSASVEIAEYRPIFMMGAVQTPGQFPYAPGMTVLKAVSVAGGLRRADAGQRFARDFLQAKGDGDVLIAERNRLLVRRLRLVAEMQGKTAIEIPDNFKNIPDLNQLLDSEKAIMNSRGAKLQAQLSSLADLKSLLNTQIEAFGKKSETQTRQLKLVEEDRDKVNSLSEQGLALSSRKLSAEQQVSDLQSNLLDIDTSTLKAKQDLNQAVQDEKTTKNDWDAQLAQELQDTEAQLDEIDLKLSTNRGLMAEALLQSAESAATKGPDDQINVAYSIVREKDGKATETAVDENTKVLPGDVVKVNVKLDRPAMR